MLQMYSCIILDIITSLCQYIKIIMIMLMYNLLCGILLRTKLLSLRKMTNILPYTIFLIFYQNQLITTGLIPIQIHTKNNLHSLYQTQTRIQTKIGKHISITYGHLLEFYIKRIVISLKENWIVTMEQILSNIQVYLSLGIIHL